VEHRPPALAPVAPAADLMPTGNKPQPQWMHYGDMIRILGTIVVVIGHVSDMVFYSTEPLSRQWWVCNTWDAASRWAVPIYIMLSGSLLLDPHRTESPSKFYHKRLMRIGVPLVFWSLFFMWVDVYYTGWRATINPAFETDKAFLWPSHSPWQWFVYLVFSRPQLAWINLLKGEPYVHMHFIFRIAGLYAFTPLIRICLGHVPRSMVTASVILMLALSSADSIANNITVTELSAFARFVPFLGYYLAGYMLREVVLSRTVLFWCWVGWIGSIALLAGCTGLLVQHYVVDAGLDHISGPPSMSMILYDFLSPLRVIMAICAWVVLVHLFRDPWPQGERGRGIIRFWANTTLGLYLIHPLFREMWYTGFKIGSIHLLSHGFDATWPNMWVGVPLSAAMVYVPSLISTIIIMQIPYVRRIAG
jgi:surface polysaccharide O-acyltransferase-like enzyme